ncbi:MAG: winged helix-turn-helix domain-containing protein [Anaerolineales bacterium]
MAELNEIIHQPVRLRLMAALVAIRTGESADFTFLRDLLGVTDGNLGAHLRKLEEAGYIQLTKKFVNRKPRTYASATATGREVFRNQVAALEEIIKGAAGAKRKKE